MSERDDHICVGVPVGHPCGHPSGHPCERLELVGKVIEAAVNREEGWGVVVAGSGRRWGVEGIRVGKGASVEHSRCLFQG